MMFQDAEIVLKMMRQYNNSKLYTLVYTAPNVLDSEIVKLNYSWMMATTGKVHGTGNIPDREQ